MVQTNFVLRRYSLTELRAKQYFLLVPVSIVGSSHIEIFLKKGRLFIRGLTWLFTHKIREGTISSTPLLHLFAFVFQLRRLYTKVTGELP